MKRTLTAAVAAAFALATATLVHAGHANPWADADDTVLEQFHDTNQTRSIDTPGEDEMRGVMVQKAFGKTSGVASDSSGLSDAPQGGDASGARGGKGRGRNR